MFYYYWDPTYVLVLIGVIICAIASMKMHSTFNRYSQVRNQRGLTGREAAEIILRNAGIHDVTIGRIAGNLTDHYDPSNKTLRLSESIYNSNSVAAIGVAAHECGHAIQHAKGYAPLQFRTMLVPVVNFGSSIAWPLILFGFLFSGNTAGLLLKLGILAFSLAVLFQIVTLPVEFDASKRALRILSDSGMLFAEEVRSTRKVLVAAALTYVAGALSSILQLLRLVILAGGRNDD